MTRMIYHQFGHQHKGMPIEQRCQFLLETAAKKNKEENALVSMIKVWFGLKKTNLTPEQERKENVKNIKIFAESTMILMDPSSLEILEEFYKINGVMEDLDKKLLEKYRKN